MFINYYDLLEISPSASPRVIKSAYRALVQQHHPDINPKDPTAEEKTKLLNEAYDILSDLKKKSAYDVEFKAYTDSKTKNNQHSDSSQNQYKNSNTKKEDSASQNSADNKKAPPNESAKASSTSTPPQNKGQKFSWIVKIICTVLVFSIVRSCSNTMSYSGPSPQTYMNPDQSLLAAEQTSMEYSQPSSTDWQIMPGERVGMIFPYSSEADLQTAYGIENVSYGKIYIGEGQYEWGTILFPNEPNKHIEIIWKIKSNNSLPNKIYIRNPETLWTLENGITINTPLIRLIELNKSHFNLFGFGWDYGGTISSWEKGSLAKMMGANGQIIIRLSLPETSILPSKIVESVYGETEFSSSTPAMMTLNPVVKEIIISFDKAPKNNTTLKALTLCNNNPISSDDILACAKEEFEKADVALNLKYKKLITALNEPSAKELISEELLWIKSKDAICGKYTDLPIKDDRAQEEVERITERLVSMTNGKYTGKPFSLSGPLKMDVAQQIIQTTCLTKMTSTRTKELHEKLLRYQELSKKSKLNALTIPDFHFSQQENESSKGIVPQNTEPSIHSPIENTNF
jgi:curved DNA-binding protein CbpA/uncharacterized protein YecT (DUF1311 family)